MPSPKSIVPVGTFANQQYGASAIMQAEALSGERLFERIEYPATGDFRCDLIGALNAFRRAYPPSHEMMEKTLAFYLECLRDQIEREKRRIEIEAKDPRRTTRPINSELEYQKAMMAGMANVKNPLMPNMSAMGAGQISTPLSSWEAAVRDEILKGPTLTSSDSEERSWPDPGTP